MTTVIRAILGGGGGTTLALGALLALLAAALLTIHPAAADGHPADIELVLSLAEDSDNIVPPGGEFTVEAALRFTTPHTQERRLNAADGSWLRLAGDLDWEDRDFFTRLNITEHMVMGGTPLSGVDAAGDPLGNTVRMVARAADGRLIVARGNTNKLYLFDAWNKRQVGIIDAPAGAHASTFGGGTTVVVNPRLRGVRSVATWQQDEDTWWVFAGSRLDTVGAHTEVGRLYIYRVDWTAAGVQVGAPTIIHPSPDEFRNRYNADTNTEFGYSLNISRDGSTLAVTAPWANHMGAVYIYSRPDGEGEDWSDITHADAVKATPAVVPAWGTGVDSTRPFTPAATGRTDASTDCDVWCSAVWAEVDVRAGELWWTTPHRIGLSADGRVIAVGRPGKRYASTTPGGSFSSPKDYTGEIQVYVAPAGGWSAAPRADAGGRTLFATRTDASGFKPAQHYAAGPLRRITKTSAKLTILPWADTSGGHYFATAVDVSNDGAAVVTTAFAPAGAHVFQLDPGEEWSGDMVYTARLQASPHAGLHGGVEFSGDDRTIAMGDIHTSGNHAGEIFLHTRPADGVWADATLAGPSGRVVRSPEGAINNRRWGGVLYDLGGERLIISEYRRAGGALWLSDGGCTQRVADGLATWTCPITLADARVVVPKGTPDGVVTISGSVAVSLSGLDGNATTVRDTLEVTIGEVDELAQVEFDFDTDAATGRPQPAVVEPGGSTTLLLKLLNENGKASAKGAAAAVLLTATRGSLSARLGSASGEACATGGAPSACKIADATTALTAANTDQIRLTLTHPGAAKAGTARVWAVVSGATGETFETEQFTVTFSGPPAALAISQPATALLGYDPGESADQRNAATLVVSATDAGDNKATVPSTRYSAKLTDSDGKTVAASKAGVVWPLREGNAADGALLLSGGNPQARVTIAAGRSAPLASGEYTLELSAGSGRGKLTATQTVVVTGGAAEVALSADPAGAIELDGSVTLTATVTDSSGAPVPDGTPVTFAEQSTGTNVTLVLLSQSEQRTRDGQASATLRAVGVGGAYVTAEADGVSGAQSIMVAAPPPPPLDPLVGLAVGTFNTWIGSRATTASELYAQLEGVARLIKWDGIEWIGYGETDGLLNSGSVDFAIERGDVLWLDGE